MRKNRISNLVGILTAGVVATSFGLVGKHEKPAEKRTLAIPPPDDKVLIYTQPEIDIWEQGGGPYSMHVYFDNRGLDFPIDPEKEKTVSTMWQFNLPSGINFESASLPLPSENDFFDGYEMSKNSVTFPTTSLRRTANAGADGPAERVGRLGTYAFTVDINAPLGQTNFYIDEGNSEFLNPYVEPQSFETYNQPFTIISPPSYSRADFNKDGKVNNEDHNIFEACATAPMVPYNAASLPAGCAGEVEVNEGIIAPDFDEDGDVDHEDFGKLQECFSGEDEADSTCESLSSNYRNFSRLYNINTEGRTPTLRFGWELSDKVA